MKIQCLVHPAQISASAHMLVSLLGKTIVIQLNIQCLAQLNIPDNNKLQLDMSDLYNTSQIETESIISVCFFGFNQTLDIRKLRADS